MLGSDMLEKKISQLEKEIVLLAGNTGGETVLKTVCARRRHGLRVVTQACSIPVVTNLRHRLACAKDFLVAVRTGSRAASAEVAASGNSFASRASSTTTRIIA